MRRFVLLLAMLGAACARGAGPARPAAAPAAAETASPADVQFITGMIEHHAQAVVMAGWAPTHGAGSAVRTLCERILVSQLDEIEAMRTWLRDVGQPVPAATGAPARMTMGGMEHHALMPGMLTEEQMAELDRARGAEFDRLFLTYMIQHHEGAIRMVEGLFASQGAAQDNAIYKIASDIFADQDSEIDRMQRMLAALP